MPNLKHTFAYGSRVGIIVTENYQQGVVMGFSVIGGGDPCYTVTWADGETTQHYEIELEQFNDQRVIHDDEAWKESLRDDEGED